MARIQKQQRDCKLIYEDVSAPEKREQVEAQINNLMSIGYELSRASFNGEKNQYLSILMVCNDMVEYSINEQQ